jgi:hypothetical protein
MIKEEKKRVAYQVQEVEEEERPASVKKRSKRTSIDLPEPPQEQRSLYKLMYLDKAVANGQRVVRQLSTQDWNDLLTRHA